MKKKTLIILGSLLILSLIGPSIAQAFTIGNVDGVWGYINGVSSSSNYYPVDIIGYARNNSMAPTRTDQTYRLQGSVCSPMQNISPPWPNTTRWTQVSGVNWTDLGEHTSTCTNAPDLFFSEYVYDQRTGSNQTDRVGIEIVNRTGSTVQLADYDVLLFPGDRASFTRIALSNVSLANNEVYVLVSNNATGQTTQWDQTFSASDNYRTIVLVKNIGGSQTEGARCDRWGTGPGNTPTAYSDWNPGVQTGPANDENQVRYGRDAYLIGSTWNSYSCEVTDWAEQSGFGFQGANGPITPAALQPFLLGQFTHYNQQVFASDDNYNNNNPFNWVDLTVTVPVSCNDGSAAVPPSFSFTPHFVLDETSNKAGSCIYGDTGDTACPDKVTIEFPTTNPTFTCSDGTYTVSILGFTETGLGTDPCWVSYDEDSVAAAFITQEDQENHACLWARIEQPVADISAAKTCHQFDTRNPYYLITTSNLGPGFSRGVTMTDTLPSGVTFNSYTSQLITTSGTINQGTCTNTGQTVACSLGTPLLDYSTDPLAKWVVRINVNLAGGDNITNTATVSALTHDPVTTNNTGTATCNSSAVSIISFDAENLEEGILLTWETAEELNNLGFNLYRAEDLQGPKVQVNSKLIPSRNPGGTSGAVYEFLDRQVIAGKNYYYWLEDIDFSLLPTLYGPITVTR